MAYLLDANVFIEAKRLYYAPDFCPAFWDWLDRENAAGVVLSIDKVGDELAGGSDAFSQWTKTIGARMFQPLDDKVVDAMPRVHAWVKGRPYRTSAVSAFLQDADYYLIAYALAHKHVLVTHEVPGDGAKHIAVRIRPVGPTWTSPGRSEAEPWERDGVPHRSPEGGDIHGPRPCRPCGAPVSLRPPFPRACALGWDMAPLRG